MGVRAQKLTPEVLIEVSQRSAAIPNHDGTLVLFESLAYFEHRLSRKAIRILNIATGSSTLVTNYPTAHDAIWLPNSSNKVLWLDFDTRCTQLLLWDADRPSAPAVKIETFPTDVRGLKAKLLPDGTIALAVFAKEQLDGSLEPIFPSQTQASSARAFQTIDVRYNRKYAVPERYNIWYSRLVMHQNSYMLASPLQRLIRDSDLEAATEINKFHETADFDVCDSGIVFIGRRRAAGNSEYREYTDVYFVPLNTFTESLPNPPVLIKDGKYGKSSGVRCSPNGKEVAFIRCVDQDPTDKRVMLACLDGDLHAFDFLNTCKISWQPSPLSVSWDDKGEKLFIIAEECGRKSLFRVSRNTSPSSTILPLLQEGSVSAVHSVQNDNRILVTSSSLVDSCIYHVIDASEPSNREVVFSYSKQGLKFALSPDQISEIYFDSSRAAIQAWCIRPSNFDNEKKYPLALLIHDGPHQAWSDEWRWDWNLAAWAEQGYVVVAPNISGSTGFGNDFAAATRGQWGGLPYQDLENCLKYIEDYMPFVDTSRSIFAGTGYGGFLANWIQGNPLGSKFKAIICDSGIFNTQTLFAGSFYGRTNDFDGPIYPWTNYENLQRWNPARPDLLGQWKTPMLVCHNDQNYRVNIEHGLSAFTTCQARGVKSRFVNFPDEGHTISQPLNLLDWYKHMFDWAKEYTSESRDEEEHYGQHEQYERREMVVEDLIDLS